MSKILRVILGVLLVIIVIILFYFANRYSYIETIEISIKDNNEYFTVEPFRYDINRIRKYYMFTNTIIDHEGIEEAFECVYKVRINNTDEICYDGGTYALYTKNIESLDDLKDAVSTKNINIKKSKVKRKVIVMNKSFAKMLKEL